MIKAGACALKLHEDWGTTPAAIDCCLSVADDYDVQVMIHTDTLERGGFVEDTIKAFKGRTIHAFHTEGAGGGHAPDIIKVAGLEQRAAVVDQSDAAVHQEHHRRASRHADGVPPSRSVDRRGSGVRREPHPQGDHRGGGHPARPRRALDDVVGQPGHGPHRRGHHPHLADRRQDEAAARAAAEEKGDNDNARAKRYVAKYTINPAIAHGVSKHIGSVEKGKLADLVLWSPAFFGVKPDCMIKGGSDRGRADGRSQCLDPDAAAGALPADVRRLRQGAHRLVAGVRLEGGAGGGLRNRLGVEKQLVAVENTRGGISKKSMVHNGATPDIKVDPETYEVARGRRAADLRAGRGAADGAALFPVLIGSAVSD